MAKSSLFNNKKKGELAQGRTSEEKEINRSRLTVQTRTWSMRVYFSRRQNGMEWRTEDKLRKANDGALNINKNTVQLFIFGYKTPPYDVLDVCLTDLCICKLNSERHLNINERNY